MTFDHFATYVRLLGFLRLASISYPRDILSLKTIEDACTVSVDKYEDMVS